METLRFLHSLPCLLSGKHDAVDSLREVLDNALWSHLHLQTSRDGMRLNAWNRLSRYLLYLVLLLWSPLGGACQGIPREKTSQYGLTMEAQNWDMQGVRGAILSSKGHAPLTKMPGAG